MNICGLPVIDRYVNLLKPKTLLLNMCSKSTIKSESDIKCCALNGREFVGDCFCYFKTRRNQNKQQGCSADNNIKTYYFSKIII